MNNSNQVTNFYNFSIHGSDNFLRYKGSPFVEEQSSSWKLFLEVWGVEFDCIIMLFGMSFIGNASSSTIAIYLVKINF